MWVPKSLLDLFSISRETVDLLNKELAITRADRDSLKDQLSKSQIMSDWMRMRVNQLEAERVALIEKAYPGLRLPAPEIAKIANRVKDGFDLQALFEDQGDPSDDQSKKVPNFPAFS